MAANLAQRVSTKVIIRVGDEVLILKPSAIDRNRHWHLPGGIRDDSNEQLTQTAAREVVEETSLIIDPRELVLVTYGEWLAYDQNEDVSVTALFFTITLTSKPNIMLSHEHDDAAWVTLQSLGDYEVNPETKLAVEQVLEARS